jgi:trans-aconitate methyltransferase
MGWDHLRVHEADPVTWTPTERVDAVICNHSLTSIDQWQAMLDHVRTWLRPGGLLAVADFGVSTREMDASLEDHAPLTRRFWTAWLARDGINLDPRMLPALRSGFTQQLLIQDQAWVSWVPVKAPWFRFIGRR